MLPFQEDRIFGQYGGLSDFWPVIHDPNLRWRPTRALQIDQQEFYDAMAEDFNITRAIVQALIHSPVATS